MNTNYQYNQTIFSNEEYTLISIIDADWQIEVYSTEIIFREKYPIDDIDYVFCGLLNQFSGMLPKYEFARLLGFSLEDIPEKNIYRDKAEEMVLDDLLKECELFGLIDIQKGNEKEKILNPVLTLTNEGRDSLNIKLKYRTWKGEFDCFKNYFDSKNPQFDFLKHFDLKSVSPNKSNFEVIKRSRTRRRNVQEASETEFFCKIQDKTIYQLIENQLDKASIGSFELCTIKSSLKKENKNQKIQYALFQSQEADNLLLVLQNEEVQEELTSIINDPINRKFKEKLELQCKFKALLNDDSAIFDGRVVNEYSSLWNKRELIQDSRLKWSDDALWAIFETSFISNDWSFISQKAPLEILKERISQYNNRLNWAILSERLDDDYIYEHIYTEGYQWDFEILSSRDSDFVWLLITEINNYNSKKEQEQQIVANWDFLIITDNLSEERINFLLPHKLQLDFIQLSKKQPEFVLDCMNEILKINANSLNNNDHYSANWDWKFISENWNLETIWNNIDILENNLNWYVFINRAFSDVLFSKYFLGNEEFNAKLLKNKDKVRPTFRLENLIWSESLIDLFNEVGILLWQSYSQEGFECNPFIEWTSLLFQKYAPFIITDKGKNHFSQSIKSWDYVFIAPDFEWDWIELSRNKHLNFDLPVLNQFKNQLDWTIVSKRVNEDLILGNFFNFEWDFRILSIEKNGSFIQVALSQNNGIAAKGWNWGMLSERLDENFILEHIFDLNWDFTVLSRKKSDEFIKKALNQDESIFEKNWDWKHLTKILDTDFVIENLTVVNDKWDWVYLTREKFNKDEIIELCNDTVEYWDWSYLLTNSFSIEELTDEDFFILIAAYLNLIQNDELRNKYWSILTKKMPPEFFVQNDYENLYYVTDLVLWDWSYLSQHPRFDYTIDFIQKFTERWDWCTLSKNKKINSDRQCLYQFREYWDWQHISQYSRFIFTQKELNINVLRRFQSYIDFHTFSHRNDVIINQQLIDEFSDENWDFIVLSSIKSLQPTYDFLKRYAEKDWDWKILSRRKDLKVEIKKNGTVFPVRFINKLILEFQKKEWDWQYLSTREDINPTFDFIKTLIDKPWDFNVLSLNEKITWNKELIYLLRDKGIDWSHSRSFVNEKNELDAKFIKKFQSFINFETLSQRTDILINNEIVNEFSNKNWDWQSLSFRKDLNFTSDFIQKFIDKNWNFEPISRNNTIIWNINLLNLLKDKEIDWSHLSKDGVIKELNQDYIKEFYLYWDWEQLSQNKEFILTNELIKNYKIYWSFNILSKRSEILENPEIVLEFKEEAWDWLYLSYNFRCNLDENILSSLQDKLDWNLLSQNEKVDITIDILKRFEDRWNFMILNKYSYRLSHETQKAIQIYFHQNPKLKFLYNIEAQYSPWKGYVYHFTHLANAVKIIKEMAIKSRYTANQINNSAGNVPDSSDKPKSYARFYFRPQTPAQFYNENLGKSPSDNYIKTKEWTYYGERYSYTKFITEYSKAASMGYPKCPVPIFFKIDIKEVLDKYYYNCFISNGNMQSNWANIFTIQEGLNNFDFDNLYMDFDPSNVELYKKASQQEFLVRNQLNISGLSSLEIICQCDEDKETLLNFIGRDHLLSNKIRVENYSPLYHFGNKRLNIEKTDNTLSVSTSFNGNGKTIIKTNKKNCIEKIEGEIYKVKPYIIEAGKNVKITFSDEVGFQVCFIDESNQEWLLYGTNEFD